MSVSAKFNKYAERYDQSRQKLIPCYSDFYQTVIKIIPFLTKLFQHCNILEKEHPEKLNPKNTPVAKKIKSIIDANPEKDLTLEPLAKLNEVFC
jgi:hypothetical protein